MNQWMMNGVWLTQTHTYEMEMFVCRFGRCERAGNGKEVRGLAGLAGWLERVANRRRLVPSKFQPLLCTWKILNKVRVGRRRSAFPGLPA